MVSFYIGYGCEDVTSDVSYFSILGKKLYHDLYLLKEYTNLQLVFICHEVVADGLKMEIAVIIKQ